MRLRRKFLLLCVTLAIAVLFLQKKVEVDVSTAKASGGGWVIKPPAVSKKTFIVGTRSQKRSDPPKTINTKRSKKSPIAPEKMDLLCKLKSAHLNVPVSGEVQIYMTRMSPFFGSDMDNVAWIKSDSCPAGMYSIVHFSDDGGVSREIDCRYTSPTEIATMSGEQGNIDHAFPGVGETNLAIIGNGYFVLRCPSGEFILTRDGKFRQGSEGNLVNSDGCTLLNQNGNPFHNFDVNRTGCNLNGDCVATMDPSFDEVYGLEYLNNHSFQATDIGQLTGSITKKGDKILRPSFFVNALEDIHDPERGLTTVSWGNHPRLNLDDIECL